METKKLTLIEIQKEKGTIDSFSKAINKVSSCETLQKNFKIYDPRNCPGYPACKVCMNILC